MDSGSGGLTVLRALEEIFPDRSFIYLGDHANAPYGDRQADEIYGLLLRCLTYLFQEGCSLVIVACNTAVARGLRRLQRDWLPVHYPDRRVLGVIVPVVESVTGMPWSVAPPVRPRAADAAEVVVGVFATQHTVASGVFASEIHQRAPHIKVWQQACPRLVPLIEADAAEEILQVAVERYVARLTSQLRGSQLDECLLGCTHYPLIEPLFRKALPAGVQLLSQPAITAQSLVAYLARHPEFSATSGSSRSFLTTGTPAVASRLASKFYGRSVTFQPVPQESPLLWGREQEQ